MNFKKSKKKRIIILENTCLEWLLDKNNNKNSWPPKYTAIKFIKNFYDNLIFFNTSEILAQLKVYLDKKMNQINFYQWYQPLKQIGVGSFAQVTNFF